MDLLRFSVDIFFFFGKQQISVDVQKIMEHVQMFSVYLYALINLDLKSWKRKKY